MRNTIGIFTLLFICIYASFILSAFGKQLNTIHRKYDNARDDDISIKRPS